MTEEITSELANIDTKQFNLPEPTVFKKQMEGAFAKMYERIDSDLASRKIDLTTDKGRKQIASDARKISTLKARMAEKAAELVADQKAIIQTVTQTRQAMEAEFDKRRDLAREPLTKWEAAMKAIDDRAKAEREFMTNIRSQSFNGVFISEMTSAQLANLRDIRSKMVFAESAYGEKSCEISDLNLSVIAFLEAAEAAASKAEKQAAELEELRAMRDEKLKQEAKAEADRIAAEEISTMAARQEADRIAAEKAEAERIAAEEKRIKEKAEADAKSRIEAAEAAAKDAIAKAKADADAAIKKAMDDHAAKEKVESDRIAAEAAETKRREEDQNHRRKINQSAVSALQMIGLSDDHAKAVVVAIAKFQIPSITIKY